MSKHHASLILNKREKFMVDNLRKVKQHPMSIHSELGISFNSQSGIHLLNSIDEKILPNLNTITLKDVGYAPGLFDKFICASLPQHVQHLKIYDSNFDLSSYRLNDIYSTIRRKVRKSVRLSGFEMSAYNLECLLGMCSKLQEIDFSGCRLIDDEELMLDDKFENLRSLNLEEIGLSRMNVGNIGKTILHLGWDEEVNGY